MKPKHLILAGLILLLAACSDEGPVSAPGVMTATLLSPNGGEGAALVTVIGEGVGAVTSVGDTEAYSYREGTTTRVVLVNQIGGELSFRFALADTLELLEWAVHEVAGPDDALRSATSGYALRLRP